MVRILSICRDFIYVFRIFLISLILRTFFDLIIFLIFQSCAFSFRMLHVNYHYFSFYMHVTILVHVIEASVSGDSQSKKISSPVGGKSRPPASAVTPSKKFFASSVHQLPLPRRKKSKFYPIIISRSSMKKKLNVDIYVSLEIIDIFFSPIYSWLSPFAWIHSFMRLIVSNYSYRIVTFV